MILYPEGILQIKHSSTVHNIYQYIILTNTQYVQYMNYIVYWYQILTGVIREAILDQQLKRDPAKSNFSKEQYDRF